MFTLCNHSYGSYRVWPTLPIVHMTLKILWFLIHAHLSMLWINIKDFIVSLQFQVLQISSPLSSIWSPKQSQKKNRIPLPQHSISFDLHKINSNSWTIFYRRRTVSHLSYPHNTTINFLNSNDKYHLSRDWVEWALVKYIGGINCNSFFIFGTAFVVRWFWNCININLYI